MTHTELALLGYIAWFIFLVILIEIYRTAIVVKDGKAANSFALDGNDISPLMARLIRAHANSYESFPFIGGILLFAIASSTQEITNALALYLLGARVAQSITHIISANELFVKLRFVFFIIQQAICIYWIAAYLLP